MLRPRVVALIASFIVLFATPLALAWTGPTQSAPNGNVAAPVNIGATAQDKTGFLGLNTTQLSNELLGVNGEGWFNTLAVFGNELLQGGSYLNFGSTWGSGGYGLWDNSGTLEYKNSGGSWTSLSSAASQWTTSGSAIYYNGGSVGIGASGPAAKLEVNGTVQIDDRGDGCCSQLRQKSGNSVWDTYIYANGSYSLYQVENTSGGTGLGNIFNISNAGNVGIGTTNPQEKLDLAGSGWISAQDNVTTNSNNATGITWYYPTPTSYGIYQTAGTWASPNYQQLDMAFQTGIILDPGSAYGKSYVDIPEGGLHVDAGGITSSQYCIGSSCITTWAQAGNGSTIGGSGSTNYVPRFTAGTTLGNSTITDNGSSATAGGNFFVNGTLYDGANTAYYLKPSSTSNLYSATFASGPFTNDWFRVNGGSGIYWQSYGGGWYMGDGTWLRTYPNGGSTGIWANNGNIGTNGGITVGYGGSGPPSGGAIFSNDVGIGTASPGALLNIVAANQGPWAFSIRNATFSGSESGAFRIYQDNSGETHLYNNGTDALDINPGGAVSINGQWPCLANGTNCPATGIGGSGTTNHITKFTAGTSVGNSNISDDGTTITLGSSANHLVGSGTDNWFPYTNGDNYIRPASGAVTYLRGPLYDEDNTAYYLDPNNGSVLNGLTVNNLNTNGGLNVAGGSTFSSRVNVTNSGRAISASSEGAADWSGCFGSDCLGGPATQYGVYGNGSVWAGQFNGNVDVTGNTQANAFLYNSDERLKKDIEPLQGNLAAVLALQPVSYLWKNPASGAGEQIGFIAQQVQQVVPSIVHTDASTTLESVDYARITPLLVGSVQELDQKIQDQQTQIDTQQQQLETQQQEISTLETQVKALTSN